MKEKKIEDFGEKIEGARKDLRALRSGAVELSGAMIDGWSSKEQEQYINKDLVWKRPDYQDMVDNGLAKEMAYFIKTIRDALPPKPPEMTEEGIKGYVEFVQYVRDSAMKIKAYSDIPSFKSNMMDKYLSGSGHYYNPKPETYGCFQNKLLRALLRSQSALEREVGKKLFCYSEDERLKIFYIDAIFTPNQFTSFDLHQETRQKGTEHEYGFLDIYAKTKTLYGSSTKIIRIQDENKKCPDLTREDFKDDKYYVVSKNEELIFRDIETKEEAERLALEWAKAAEGLVKAGQKNTSRSHKEKLLPPQLEHIHREGENHRENNLNVSGEDILDSFKLRGGQFGNWTNQNDRQANMNMLFDSFRDLAVALDVSYDSISLMKNNKERTASLAIAWGARGHSGALAHYEPIENVINLTKMRGAGSLAHEWGHALDCFVKEMCGLTSKYGTVKAQKFMATHCRDENNPFADVVKAMCYKDVEGERRPKPTDYYIESQETDKQYAKTDNGYWSSVCEMFARAFSCYVSDKLKEKGIRSDYLTGHSESTVYPKGEERETINKSIDKLIDSLKERGFLKHQIHDIQAEAKKQPVIELSASDTADSIPLYEEGEQLSFFSMTDNEPENFTPSAKEVETFAAEMQMPSYELKGWKINYIHKDAPDTVRSFDTVTSYKVAPLIMGKTQSCEEIGIHDLSLFREKAISGAILQYKVIEGDCQDFMKPWTVDELCEALEQGVGEADICRCTSYEGPEHRIVCTVKVQDMGDEELQIVSNIVKSDKDENNNWQQTYSKNYYCEKEEFKNITIEDFTLLGYKDYDELINDAVRFAESGKEQLYSPPRNAGNYKVFNDKKATEYLYTET